MTAPERLGGDTAPPDWRCGLRRRWRQRGGGEFLASLAGDILSTAVLERLWRTSRALSYCCSSSLAFSSTFVNRVTFHHLDWHSTVVTGLYVPLRPRTAAAPTAPTRRHTPPLPQDFRRSRPTASEEHKEDPLNCKTPVHGYVRDDGGSGSSSSGDDDDGSSIGTGITVSNCSSGAGDSSDAEEGGDGGVRLPVSLAAAPGWRRCASFCARPPPFPVLTRGAALAATA